jgi:DNA-binding transcriptional MerR regulator
MLIGDLAASAGLQASAIRFYEQSGLLSVPLRTAGGCRDYRPQNAHRHRRDPGHRQTGHVNSEPLPFRAPASC